MSNQIQTKVRKACHATHGAVGGCYWPQCKCYSADFLESLLTTARAEATEAAARVAEGSPAPAYNSPDLYFSGLEDGYHQAAADIATAIRTAPATQDKDGEEGT